MCFNPNFRRDHNNICHFLALDHGLLSMVWPNWQIAFIAQIQTLMIPLERSLSKLSENQKIVEIESTKIKLW